MPSVAPDVAQGPYAGVADEQHVFHTEGIGPPRGINKWAILWEGVPIQALEKAGSGKFGFQSPAD